MTAVRCGNIGCAFNDAGVCKSGSIELSIEDPESPFILCCEVAKPEQEKLFEVKRELETGRITVGYAEEGVRLIHDILARKAAAKWMKFEEEE